jgi:hypothetical protein
LKQILGVSTNKTDRMRDFIEQLHSSCITIERELEKMRLETAEENLYSLVFFDREDDHVESHDSE